jgi:exonuclease III
MANDVSIIERNVKLLLWHQHEVKVILSTENTDICHITETHFTKESFIRFKSCITHYTIHPANAVWGGSAVIIRNNIKPFEEENFVSRDIQATIVTVETSKQRLTASAIYCQTRYNIYANEFKKLFDKINSRFIIGGDFNAQHTHWSSRLITTKGRELYKAVIGTGCEIVCTGKPTYWPTDPKELQI